MFQDLFFFYFASIGFLSFIDAVYTPPPYRESNIEYIDREEFNRIINGFTTTTTVQTTTPTTTRKPIDVENLRYRYLDDTNNFRQRLKMPNLKYCSLLQDEAQIFTDENAKHFNGTLTTDSESMFGEYVAILKDNMVQNAVLYWSEGVEYFDLKKDDMKVNSARLGEMVAFYTKEMGCGVTETFGEYSGHYLVNCKFYPNMNRQYNRYYKSLFQQMGTTNKPKRK